MQVEIWSDIVCPWCYIGKRRFERALGGFAGAEQVQVRWRSFQLDPGFPVGVSEPVYDSLAQKMGASTGQVEQMTARVAQVAAEEGLDYDLAGGVMVNTFDAHRLLQAAQHMGVGGRAHEVFLRAQLVQARDLSDPVVLVELAQQAGLEADHARRVLGSDEYADGVHEDVALAQELGGSGVPFFVLDRAFGISGAQPVEVFASALERAGQASNA